MFPFTIDNYLNPYYPRSIVPRLPRPIQRVLGNHKGLQSFKSSWILYIDVLIGSFISILVIEGVFKHSGVFKSHNAPVIIASYGASAILLFNANGAPLSQPRNILFGHFLSALVGVILQKLFGLSSGGRHNFYVGGALSVGIASVVMSVFNCVHPPSGASALMPLVDDNIREMGWWYLPAHLVSSVLMIGVACVTNNILRKYPLYWWTPYKKEEPKDEEKCVPTITPGTTGDTVVDKATKHRVKITTEEVIIPNHIKLDSDEIKFLEKIQAKLQQQPSP